MSGKENIKQRVDSLLSRMSPKEKIGQLHQVWGIDVVPDAPKPDDMVRQGLITRYSEYGR